MQKLISLDLETTGFDKEKDQIIEFGAIKFDLTSGETETLSFLINPEREIPEIVTHITNIKNEDVSAAPLFATKMAEISEFLQDCPIIGHNIQFDTNFLRAKGIPLNNPEYDTHDLANILMPELPSHSLEVISKILNLEHEQKHRALDDAIAAMELFKKLAVKFEELPEEILEKIKSLTTKSDWAIKDFIRDIKSNSSSNDEVTSTPKVANKKVSESSEHNIPSPELQEKATKILASPKTEIISTTIFETLPPFNSLTEALIPQTTPDQYLCIPQKLFQQLSDKIPTNTAQLDVAQNYISPKRLQEFENKDHFETHEIIGLIKVIMWMNRTSTGLLREVRLFQKENDILDEINANPLVVNSEEEPFIKASREKDATGGAICTHEYFLENHENIKDLILIDFNNFADNLIFNNSIYLNLNLLFRPLDRLEKHFPGNPLIESLKNKSTILFALIGILFEKYNDNNSFKATTQIDITHLYTSEWLNIGGSLSELLKTSKELIHLINDQTQIQVQQWKANLHKLFDIFKTPDLDHHFIQIEKNYDDSLVLRKIHINPGKLLQEKLQNLDTLKIIGYNIDLQDEGEFFKKHYQFPSDTKIEKLDTITNKFALTIFKDFPEFEAKANEILLKFIPEFLQNNPGRTAFVINSQKQLEYFTVNFGSIFKDTDINVVSTKLGSMGKVISQLRDKELPERQPSAPGGAASQKVGKTPSASLHEGTGLLLTSVSDWNKVHKDEVDELIDNVILLKLPFDPPSDPYLSALRKNYLDDFKDLQVPRTIIALKNIFQKLPHPERNKQAIILDSRIISKPYGKDMLKNLEIMAEVKITNF